MYPKESVQAMVRKEAELCSLVDKLQNQIAYLTAKNLSMEQTIERLKEDNMALVSDNDRLRDIVYG